MELIRAVEILMKEDIDQMIGKTYHMLMPIKHLERVCRSWSMLTVQRPAIQLRDIKNCQDQYITKFVLSLTVADRQQAQWVLSMASAEEVQVVQK